MPASEAGVSASPHARIAVVVLNYRTPDLVRDCIDSLRSEIDPERDVVVIVDNASGDDSVARLRRLVKEHPELPLRLLSAAENAGFAAGNNLAIESVAAEAYLLLNSDTLVQPDALSALFQALEANPGVGLVSPRLEWPDGSPQTSCFRLHTPWSELLAGARTDAVRRLLADYEVALPAPRLHDEPQWVSFAAALIRAKSLRDIGGLDPGFFMYYEDADACRRLRAMGWRLLYEPRARVVHLRGGSSPVKRLTALGKRRPRYYYQSRARFFRRAYGRWGLFAANLLWTLGRAIAWLRETFGGKAPHTVRAELRDLWRG